MKTGLNMSKQRKQRRKILAPFSPLPPVERSESMNLSHKKSQKITKKNSLIVHSRGSLWQFPVPGAPPSFPLLSSVQIRFVTIRPPSAVLLRRTGVIRVAPSEFPGLFAVISLSCISCISWFQLPRRKPSTNHDRLHPRHPRRARPAPRLVGPPHRRPARLSRPTT